MILSENVLYHDVQYIGQNFPVLNVQYYIIAVGLQGLKTTDLSTVIVTILYVDEMESVHKKIWFSQNTHSKTPNMPLLSITLSSLLKSALNINTNITKASMLENDIS